MSAAAPKFTLRFRNRKMHEILGLLAGAAGSRRTSWPRR